MYLKYVIIAVSTVVHFICIASGAIIRDITPAVIALSVNPVTTTRVRIIITTSVRIGASYIDAGGVGVRFGIV